ncbi:MBL fold metallo-hydrolase [Romboutsia lituseburensis]|uniref:Putative mRNA 3-end processing factor n=1 Tax=Romboutsia lituseburensis DSM 797 TaxID=1121325 RepID=A0A1G9NWQ9_9FIRM|nr:MBL fold metallo-hydrolase [Romboutsia lituseburensis]CEH33143.1 Beta-lactamase domain-containing protein [Romboutsia lituseburensis]SDL90829.1 putative mRNA 3-end processing factor [Romboutsia lituseburensis DSM 797]
MYKYKDIILTESDVEKIEQDIYYTLENYNIEEIENLKEIDYFIENILYIQKGKKDFLEVLSYIKYNLGEYLLAFQYGLQSFNFNQNSTGIIYATLSLLNLGLYSQAHFTFINNKEKIIDIINSNKSQPDDIINILIYFGVDITLIDDIQSNIENLKDKRKKYLYILINLIRDRKKEIFKNLENDIQEKDLRSYINEMSDIPNILLELNLPTLSDLCSLILEFKEDEIDFYKILPCDNLETYIGKALLESIDVKRNKIIYIPKTISKYDFKDNDVEIISYKSKALVSMHLLRIKDEYLIIDCGAHINNLKLEKINIENFISENNIPREKIKSIIISHAHLDHYGSLNTIQEYVDEIYMTKDTYNIINIVAKSINIDESKVKIKKDYDEFKIGNLNIKFFPTNHIKGSVGICVEYNNKKIVYTGDFSFNRQCTTQYIDQSNFYEFKDADYLIMETTCGYKNIDLPYIYNKKLFTYFVDLSIKNNKKVIVPSFSVGIAQEYFELINNSTIKANVIVDGSAIRVNEYYNKRKNNVIANNQLNHNKRKNIEEKYYENDIIIVSSGLINDISLAEKYFDLALNDKNMVTILKCKTIGKNLLERKLNAYDSIAINLIDISLSSHANYEDLLKTINMIKPKNLVMVHGKGIKLYDDLYNV